MVINFKKLLAKLINNNKDEEICNSNKSKKMYFTGHESLTISSTANATAEEVSQIAYNLMQKYRYQPKMILKFMESYNTKIVHAPKLLPLLKFLGYDEGFIPKHNSWQALILNLAISKYTKEKIKLSFEVPDLLIICKKELTLYFLAYHLHHWLAYQHKLPGYDMKTLRLFNISQNPKANFSVLSINQILSLKDAIERDKQAIDFVKKFVSEQVGAKERLDSILQGKEVKI